MDDRDLCRLLASQILKTQQASSMQLKIDWAEGSFFILICGAQSSFSKSWRNVNVTAQRR